MDTSFVELRLDHFDNSLETDGLTILLVKHNKIRGSNNITNAIGIF